MVPGIWAAHKKKSMVGINYYPLAMMYAQSAGWAIYSWADDSFFPVGAVNCLGVLLGALFSGVCIFHETNSRVRYIAFFLFVFAITVALIVYRCQSSQDDDDIAKVLGYCADVLAIIMFGSPLLQLGEVVKARNSEVIAAPMAISGAINGVFWSIYGIMVTDYYVIVPNVISGCLCFVQVFLIVVFPRKSEDDKSLKFLENRSVSEV
ncbi:Sugar efflux transporter for intercellular exchange [Phytophthora infestans]|uniref:Sugar transporter SWEET1 n=1 Tax=Phytophthora infestans TaxID=4787 RepID=A0A833STR1_PHYIN|nr:Sugar efflux transporter for intercellular exchange [Phytophthora infestans]